MARAGYALLWATSITFFLTSLILAILTGLFAHKYHALLDKPEEFYPGLFYAINTTWDSHRIFHDPVNVSLKYSEPDLSVLISIEAPFANKAGAPNSPAGVVLDLSNFENIAVFLANDEKKYIEVELGPSNHWHCSLYDGQQNMFDSGEQLQLSVWNQISSDGLIWTSQAMLPLAFLPANISSINAYRTYSNGSTLLFEAMSPVPPDMYEKPNFHLLQYFVQFNTTALFPSSVDIHHPYRDIRYKDIWADHD
ncbi:unnamed protein product [Auanema sp. JU1783]|nr:unnamed protein product [Auanema sp. JU1783]